MTSRSGCMLTLSLGGRLSEQACSRCCGTLTKLERPVTAVFCHHQLQPAGTAGGLRHSEQHLRSSHLISGEDLSAAGQMSESNITGVAAVRADVGTGLLWCWLYAEQLPTFCVTDFLGNADACPSRLFGCRSGAGDEHFHFDIDRRSARLSLAQAISGVLLFPLTEARCRPTGAATHRRLGFLTGATEAAGVLDSHSSTGKTPCALKDRRSSNSVEITR